MEVLDLRLLDCRSCYAVGGLILQKRHSRHRRTSNQTCCQGWSSVVWAQEGHALIVFSTRRSLVVGLATWFYLVGVFVDSTPPHRGGYWFRAETSWSFCGSGLQKNPCCLVYTGEHEERLLAGIRIPINQPVDAFFP